MPSAGDVQFDHEPPCPINLLGNSQAFLASGGLNSPAGEFRRMQRICDVAMTVEVLSTNLRSAYILHTKFAQFNLFRHRAQYESSGCVHSVYLISAPHIDASRVRLGKPTLICVPFLVWLSKVCCCHEALLFKLGSVVDDPPTPSNRPSVLCQFAQTF